MIRNRTNFRWRDSNSVAGKARRKYRVEWVLSCEIFRVDQDFPRDSHRGWMARWWGLATRGRRCESVDSDFIIIIRRTYRRRWESPEIARRNCWRITRSRYTGWELGDRLYAMSECRVCIIRRRRIYRCMKAHRNGECIATIF